MDIAHFTAAPLDRPSQPAPESTDTPSKGPVVAKLREGEGLSQFAERFNVDFWDLVEVNYDTLDQHVARDDNGNLDWHKAPKGLELEIPVYRQIAASGFDLENTRAALKAYENGQDTFVKTDGNIHWMADELIPAETVVARKLELLKDKCEAKDSSIKRASCLVRNGLKQVGPVYLGSTTSSDEGQQGSPEPLTASATAYIVAK